MEKNIVYPIYRKLNNNRRFYKIIDSTLFEEIQLIGSRKYHFQFKAIQYPELLFIQDLISTMHPGVEESNEKEWNSYLMV